MVYKSKTYSPAELIEKTEKDQIDLERREREKAARIRVYESLPPDITITGVHMYPLYGTVGSLGIELDGDHNDVVPAIRELLRKLPPEPAERISASCAWTQPRGHREEREKHSYESSHTKIIPICPVWARAGHVVKSSASSLEFNWFTKTQEDILLKVKAKLLQTHHWIQYRYTCGHSRGARDIAISSQVFIHKFVDARLQAMGRGSSSQTWDYNITWNDLKSAEDALRVNDEWREERQGR